MRSTGIICWTLSFEPLMYFLTFVFSSPLPTTETKGSLTWIDSVQSGEAVAEHWETQRYENRVCYSFLNELLPPTSSSKGQYPAYKIESQARKLLNEILINR